MVDVRFRRLYPDTYRLTGKTHMEEGEEVIVTGRRPDKALAEQVLRETLDRINDLYGADYRVTYDPGGGSVHVEIYDPLTGQHGEATFDEDDGTLTIVEQFDVETYETPPGFQHVDPPFPSWTDLPLV